MANNRAAAQAICIKRMKELDPSGYHAAFYESYLQKMSNDEFDAFMKRLQTQEQQLTAWMPNFKHDIKLSTDNNIRLAEKMGYSFFQRIWITDPVTKQRYLTPRKHMVYDANCSRMIQILDDKISVPVKNGQIDELTGQVRGDSRASQISGPEFMILGSKGLHSPIAELMKFRGGDLTSNRLLNDQIIKSGSASMNGIPAAGDRSAKSVHQLSVILSGMLFSNNFAG